MELEKNHPLEYPIKPLTSFPLIEKTVLSRCKEQIFEVSAGC